MSLVYPHQNGHRSHIPCKKASRCRSGIPRKKASLRATHSLQIILRETPSLCLLQGRYIVLTYWFQDSPSLQIILQRIHSLLSSQGRDIFSVSAQCFCYRALRAFRLFKLRFNCEVKEHILFSFTQELFERRFCDCVYTAST